MVSWLARTRHGDLSLSDPLDFSELQLVENYGPPDTLTLTGDVDDLAPAAKPGRGCVVWDDEGEQRFNGLATSIERRSDGSLTVVFASDKLRLYDRILYPTPTASWTAQTTTHDVQTGVHEDRILAFISRNAGPTALNITGENRRIPSLRLPVSQGRGTSNTYRGRFQNLGAVVAQHEENGNLRVTIKQTYEGTTPYLDVVIDDTPDESDWARFGPAPDGTLGLLDESFRYSISTPTATVVLSAAGGSGSTRTLTKSDDGIRASREGIWWRRVESFLDQRGEGTDTTAIAAGLMDALLEARAPIEIDAPVVTGDLEFGPNGIPVGAKVAVVIDGEATVDRVRSLTTTVQASDSDETVTVVPTVGSTDRGLTLTQRALLNALRRIRELERSQ